MKPFKKRRRGGLCATFEPGEARVIASLTGQVVELLRDRNGELASDPDPLAGELGFSGGPSLPPDDPVLQRLLPDAYRDDTDESAEFRRFTERSLTSSKVANAEAVLESLRDAGLDEVDDDSDEPLEVELDPEGVQAWLRTLTDVRLSLAVRLGIEADEDAMLLHQSEDEAVAAMTELYDWLGYVQETLVTALA
ncbi:DUF2017 domain-containing protein [Aeromicrobium sp.]|uniref:DUF2017 domain-containing protein n=1 Tax=Aeromicrobium sp. TaxID=1871063 RepID=UPI003C45053F